MKYHCRKQDSGSSLCGQITNRPDVFMYDEEGFRDHYNRKYKCKLCNDILNEKEGKQGGKEASHGIYSRTIVGKQ